MGGRISTSGAAEPAPRASLEGFPNDFVGLFLAQEGTVHAVSWDYRDECFVLSPVREDMPVESFESPEATFNVFASLYPGAEEEVELPLAETGEAVQGTLHFVRFTRIDREVEATPKSEMLSQIEFMTLQSAQIAGEVSKRVARDYSESAKSLTPRVIPINVDILPLIREENEGILNALLEIIAAKQKRLNATFGKDTVRFEFTSVSRRNEGLARELETRYRGLSSVSRNTRHQEALQSPLQGFMVTDIEEGIDYGASYLLPLEEKLTLEDNDGFYMFSSILDLAIVMTVLLDHPNKEEFYPMVRGLYEKLLGRRLQEEELKLDILLGIDPLKSQELSKRLKIPPVARYNLNDLREFYERMKDVLIAA